MSLALGSLGAGCRTAAKPPQLSPRASGYGGGRITDPSYRIGAGDRVRIASSGLSEPAVVEVQGDGCVTFPGAPAVRLDGLTVAEASLKLERDLGARFRNADVSIDNYKSQFIYVYGVDADDKAKTLPFIGAESLSELLARAGCRHCRKGFRVRVVRPGETLGAEPEIFALRIDDELKIREGPARPIILRANDYVYVEKDVGKPGHLGQLTENSHLAPRLGWFKKGIAPPGSDRRATARR